VSKPNNLNDYLLPAVREMSFEERASMIDAAVERNKGTALDPAAELGFTDLVTTADRTLAEIGKRGHGPDE
jgi:hypothetical protein